MPSIQQVKAFRKMPQRTQKSLRQNLHQNLRRPLLATAALTVALMACAPVIDNRGYIFDDRLLDGLQKGVTTMDTVRSDLGSPSTVATLNEATFFYVYSRIVTESYRAPEEVDRKVLTVSFDQNNRVRDFAVYGLEDGIIVPIVNRTTATQGQALTVLEQLFGNLGRLGDEAPGSDF